MFKTVKSKFIYTATLFVVISVGIPVLFLVSQFRANFEERSVLLIETFLNVFRESIYQNMISEEKDIQAVLKRFALNQNIDKIRIFDMNGLIKYSTDSVEIGQNIRNIEFHTTIHPDSNEVLLIDSGKLYSFSNPIKNDILCQHCHEEKDTIAYMDIDVHLTNAETRFYTGARHTLFLAIAVIVLLLLGLYFFFNYFINRPLQGVIHALGEIGKGNLNIRRGEEKEDEFGVLNRHFNSMVSQLDASEKEIRAFHFEQLQRADKLVTLGELAAEMAHEINNPAGVIMSRADYLQLVMHDNINLKPFSNDIEVILSQTQKVATITGNILKYSKKLPMDFREINLTDIIEESLKILEPRLQRRNISVKKTFKCDENNENAVIFGDAQQIEQVITNIVNNAIDALQNGGNLDISVISSEKKGVKLTIQDNGTGIDEVTRQKIFLPFYTTKNPKEGTGLGLYIVKNICKNHGAKIMCFSTPGQGTKFVIEFQIPGKNK